MKTCWLARGERFVKTVDTGEGDGARRLAGGKGPHLPERVTKVWFGDLRRLVRGMVKLA